MTGDHSPCARPSHERPGSRRRVHAHFAPFGEDWFGRRAEAFARFFGTPAFLLGQTVVVAAWIALNVAAAGLRWDPYPFILLNLGFSLQAAYAAPLILLAQTRQADRDKAEALSDAEHREAFARDAERWHDESAMQSRQLRALLESNRELVEQMRRLTEEIGAGPERRRRSSAAGRHERSGGPSVEAREARSYPETSRGRSSARPMSERAARGDPARE